MSKFTEYKRRPYRERKQPVNEGQFEAQVKKDLELLKAPCGYFAGSIEFTRLTK